MSGLRPWGAAYLRQAKGAPFYSLGGHSDDCDWHRTFRQGHHQNPRPAPLDASGVPVFAATPTPAVSAPASEEAERG